MGIDLDLSGLVRAEKELKLAGTQLVRDSAATMQEKAQSLAAADTGTMRRMIRLHTTDDGADVISEAPYSVFLEYGTGVFAEGGGGRKDPWVYYSEGFGFVTTSGAPSQPFMRPAFAEARDYFNVERKRRGFG